MQRMSRAARATRGVAGALASTLFAASSHALAGGAISWFAVVATAILALPLCTALAGRIGSLWRLAIAVGVSQFVFHWSFSGLGASSGGTEGAGTAAHAAHLGGLVSLSPGVMVPDAGNPGAASASADIVMWLGHALAAICTIALLHRGEQAFLRLIGIISRALPTAVPQSIPVSVRRSLPLPTPRAVAPLLDRLLASATVSHRGPPSVVVGTGC